MRRLRLYSSVSTLALAVVVGSFGGAHAALTLGGNYIEIGVSDYGTLGSDGSTEPGLLYDPTGMKNYGVNDFLTPGSPAEGFSFTANELGGPSSYLSNDNNYNGNGTSGNIGAFTFTSPVSTTVPGYSLAATSTGTYTIAGGATITLTNTEYFNPNSQQINISSTFSTTSTLTGVGFTRHLDPDPDVYTYGYYQTANTLGNSSYGADGNSAACGSGVYTGQTVCLVTPNTQGTITHIANIDPSCCTDENPYYFLDYGSGFEPGAASYADDGLDLTWNIGTLTAGDPVTLDYAYVLGATVTAVVAPPTSTGPTSTTPTPTPVPEPASLALLGSGLVGVATLRRRRRA